MREGIVVNAKTSEDAPSASPSSPPAPRGPHARDAVGAPIPGAEMGFVRGGGEDKGAWQLARGLLSPLAAEKFQVPGGAPPPAPSPPPGAGGQGWLPALARPETESCPAPGRLFREAVGLAKLQPSASARAPGSRRRCPCWRPQLREPRGFWEPGGSMPGWLGSGRADAMECEVSPVRTWDS